LLPELRNDVGTLTPKLERVIHTLEWVRIAAWEPDFSPQFVPDREIGQTAGLKPDRLLDDLARIHQPARVERLLDGAHQGDLDRALVA
jgi:hypothetical protein